MGDTRLYDGEGRLIAEFLGFESRRAGRASLLRGLDADLARWGHELIWVERTRQAPGHPAPRRWLVLADRGGMGAQLAARLTADGLDVVIVVAGTAFRQAGPAMFEVDPASQADFAQLLISVASDSAELGIAHLWSLDVPGGKAAAAVDWDAIHRLCCQGGLNLVRALAAHAVVTAPRLCFVTCGAQAAAGTGDVIRPAAATLIGLAQVAALELPAWDCVTVDLDYRGVEIDSLAAELLATDGEERVALRQGRRLVQRLTHTGALPALVSRRAPVHSDGVYLVTGGMGALGITVAAWLVDHGAQHLALLGRHPRQLPELEALRRAGAELLILEADVSDERSLGAALERIAATGRPLRGVVHAAGSVEDGLIATMSWQQFQRVLAPKVAGAWNIHAATAGAPLDFFVCFSSAAVVLGSVGQSNYAAANAYLDALCQYRSGLGLPALSVNWGPWAGVGMVAALDRRLQERLAARGVRTIASHDGRRLFGHLLDRSRTQLALLSVDWEQFVALHPTGRRPLGLSEIAAAADTSEPTPFMTALRAAPAAERLGMLTAHIRNLIADLLGLRTGEQVDPARSLFDLELDSLVVTELQVRLERSLGVPLGTAFVFNYPSVATMANQLARVVQVGDPAPSAPAPPRPPVPGVASEGTDDLDALSQEEIEDLLAHKLAELRGEVVEGPVVGPPGRSDGRWRLP